MDCTQYLDQIAPHVDGALPAGELAGAKEHLDGCSACRAKYEWELSANEIIKLRLPAHEPRPFLKHSIRARLDERNARKLWGGSLFTHAVAAAAVVLLLVVPYDTWRGGVGQPNLFSDVAVSYRDVTSGVPGPLPASAPAATLLDLSPWGYRLLSRKAESLDGRQGRVFVYRGRDKDYLMAREFDGSSFAIPDRTRIVRRGNKDFYTYAQDGVNLVAWQDRNMLCIIASSSSESDLVALATEILNRDPLRNAG